MTVSLSPRGQREARASAKGARLGCMRASRLPASSLSCLAAAWAVCTFFGSRAWPCWQHAMRRPACAHICAHSHAHRAAADSTHAHARAGSGTIDKNELAKVFKAQGQPLAESELMEMMKEVAKFSAPLHACVCAYACTRCQVSQYTCVCTCVCACATRCKLHQTLLNLVPHIGTCVVTHICTRACKRVHTSL
jgi:hypothetical protein